MLQENIIQLGHGTRRCVSPQRTRDRESTWSAVDRRQVGLSSVMSNVYSQTLPYNFSFWLACLSFYGSGVDRPTHMTAGDTFSQLTSRYLRFRLLHKRERPPDARIACIMMRLGDCTTQAWDSMAPHFTDSFPPLSRPDVSLSQLCGTRVRASALFFAEGTSLMVKSKEYSATSSEKCGTINS